MEVIVGTYEEFLLGYKLATTEPASFTQSFADKSHAGALKSVAVHEHFVATGGTDDRIFLYDMRTRKQINIILSHEGTINTLAFTPDSSHLLSGGDDGRMIATRINTWATEGNWKAHKGSAVHQICCHPSGKLALSLGADRVLCTWNLVKGRVAYRTNLRSHSTLGSQPDCLTWSPTGDYFSLCGPRAAEIWSIKTADVLITQKTTEKPICVCWVANDVCLVGLENGKILWINVTDDERKEHFSEAHNARVKVMTSHKDTLITISSSGEMKAWQLDIKQTKLSLICKTSIGCRPTCLSILDLTQFDDGYALENDSKENVSQLKTVSKKTSKQPELGVVTIEYEEEDLDENREKNSDEQIATSDNESPSVSDSTKPKCSQEKVKTLKRKVKKVDQEQQPKKEKTQQKGKKPNNNKK